jgi:hypothetical protein
MLIVKTNYETFIRAVSGPGSSPTGPRFWARLSPGPILLKRNPGPQKESPSTKCKALARPQYEFFSRDLTLVIMLAYPIEI